MRKHGIYSFIIGLQAKNVAEQMAAKLNNKLNYQPKEEDEPIVQDAETTFNKFEEELEINDFPQQARWKVTSKVNTYSLQRSTLNGRN